MKPPVSLADAAKALHALAPSGRATEIVLQMCGLQLPMAGPTTFAGGTEDSARPTDHGVHLGSGAGQPEPATTIPPSVRRLEPVRQASPSTSLSPDPLNDEADRPSAPPPVFLPLLSSRVSTDLLRAAGTVAMPGDHVDLNAVVKALTMARPLVSLPRLDVPTLAAGLHVMIDVGEAMEQFVEDQQDVIRHLRRAVGDPITVSYVADDPQRRGGPERRRVTWHPYVAPPAGRPVVVLSDVGCGFPRRPDATSAWLALTRSLQLRGCRVVVLAPVRPQRIPRALERGCEVVIWDRMTGRKRAAELVRLSDA